MTDKQQQIEEMAKDLCKACSIKTCKSEYPPCAMAQIVSEDLYNAGYRRVGENAVVLTQEEYNALMLEQQRLKKIVDRIPCGYELKDKTRKETAKEIINEIKRKYGKSCSEYYPLLIEITSEELDDLAKQFGVEELGNEQTD